MQKEQRYKNLVLELKQIWGDKLMYRQDNILVFFLRKLDEKNQLNEQYLKQDITQVNGLLNSILKHSTNERFQEILKKIPEEKMGKNGFNINQSHQYLGEAFLNDVMNSRHKPQLQEEVYTFLVDENFAKQRILKILDQTNKSQQYQLQGQPMSDYQYQQQGQYYGNQYQNQSFSSNNSHGQSQYQQNQLNQQKYGVQKQNEGNYSDGVQNNQQNMYSQHPTSNQLYSNSNNNLYQNPDSITESNNRHTESNYNDGFYGNEYEGQKGAGADQKSGYRQDSYYNYNEDCANGNEYIDASTNIGGGVGQRQNEYYQNRDQQYLPADTFMGEGDNNKQEVTYDVYQTDLRQGYNNQAVQYPQSNSSATPSQPAQMQPKHLQNTKQNQSFPPNQKIQQQQFLQAQQPPIQYNQNLTQSGYQPQSSSPTSNLKMKSNLPVQNDDISSLNLAAGVQQNVPQNNYQSQQKANINNRQQVSNQDQYNQLPQQKTTPIGQIKNEFNQQKHNQPQGQQQNLDLQYNQQIQQQQQQLQAQKNNQQLNSSMQQSIPINQQQIQKQPSNLPQQQSLPQQRAPQQQGNLSSSQQQHSLHNSLVGNRAQTQHQANQQQQQPMFKQQNQDAEAKHDYNVPNANQVPIQSQLNNSMHQTPTPYPPYQQQNIHGLQAYQSLNESNHSLGKGTNSNHGSQHRSSSNKTSQPSNQHTGASSFGPQAPYLQNQNQPIQMVNQNPQLNSSQYQQQQNIKFNPNTNPQQNQNIQASFPNQTTQQPLIPPQQIQQQQQYKIGGLNNSTDKTSRGIAQEDSLKGSYHQQNPQLYTQNSQQIGQAVKVGTGINNISSSHDLKSSYQQQQVTQAIQGQPQNQYSNIPLNSYNQKPVDSSVSQKQDKAIIQQPVGINKGIPPQNIKQENQVLNQQNSQQYPNSTNSYDQGQSFSQQIDSQTIPPTQPIPATQQTQKANQAKIAQQQKQIQQSGQNVNTINQNQITPTQIQHKQQQQSQQQQKRNTSLNTSMQGKLANPSDQTQQSSQYQQVNQQTSINNGQLQTNTQVQAPQVNAVISQGPPNNGKTTVQGINNSLATVQQQQQPQQIGIQPQQKLSQNQQIQQKQQQQQQGGLVGTAGYPQNIQIQNKSYSIKNSGKQIISWDDYLPFLWNPYIIDDDNKGYEVLQITKSENNSPRNSNMNDSSSTITEQQHSSYFPSKHQQLNASITQTPAQEYPSSVQPSSQYPSNQMYYSKNPNNSYSMDPNNLQAQQNLNQKGGNQNTNFTNQQYQYQLNDQNMQSNATGNPNQIVNPQIVQYPQNTVQKGNQVFDYSQTKMEEPNYTQNQQYSQQQQWMNQQQQGRNQQMQGKQVPVQPNTTNPNYQHNQQQNQIGNQMVMKQISGVGYQPQNQITSLSNIENDQLNSSQYNQSYDNSKVEDGMQQYAKNDLLPAHNIDQQYQMSHNNNGVYINQQQSKQYQMSRNMHNNLYTQDVNMQDDQMGQQDLNNEALRVRMQNDQSHMQGIQQTDPNFKKSGQEQSTGAQVVKWTPNPQGLNQDEDLNLIKDVFSKNTKYDSEMQRQITSDVQKFKQNNQNLTIRAMKMPNEKEPTFKLEIKDKKRKDFQELVLSVMPRKDQPYEIDQFQHKVPKTSSLMDIIKFWWKFEFQTIEEEKKLSSTNNQPNTINNMQPPTNNGMMPQQMHMGNF